MSASISPALPAEGLRERHLVPAVVETSSSTVSSGQNTPQNEDDVTKEKKTFGRTPDGTSEHPAVQYNPAIHLIKTNWSSIYGSADS